MSLLPQSSNMFIAGPDPSLRDAIARLMSLDPEVTVSAALAVDGFKDLSIADLIDLAESLPRASAVAPRHLVPLPERPGDLRSLLSERELQVVRLVAEGISNKEISLRMKLSDKTVKNHISHILAKLHLTARTQVAVHALRTGLA